MQESKEYNIQCISFSYIRRLGNSIAHNLTKHVKYIRDFSV